MKSKVFVLAIACGVSACNGHAIGESPTVAPAVSSATAACPANTFNNFLEEFASNPQVREAHTAPSVAVVDYRDPNALDDRSLITLQTPREEYRDFTLSHDVRGFHHVDSTGEVDPAPVDVQIQQRGADYYVRYIYGMSEGNSWLFTPKNGCWYLTRDPEPPTE